MKKSTDVALILDGMNLVHRGFFASAGFGANQKQMDEDEFIATSIRGLVNIILADIKRVKATHAAVVFDKPGANFRHRLYPEYKANRPKLDSNDMRVMVEPGRAFLKTMGIRVFGKCGVEGDDIIGSLAVNMSRRMQTYISSNDKDFASLVTRDLHLLKPKGLILDESGVEETFEVKPSQMVEYLMLLGDKADNVPGVEKVGPKTASKLLQEHGSLKAICRDAKLTPAMAKNFEAAQKHFKITKQLLTIQLEHFPQITPADLKLGAINVPKVKQACDTYGFKSLYTSIINTLG